MTLTYTYRQSAQYIGAGLCLIVSCTAHANTIPDPTIIYPTGAYVLESRTFAVNGETRTEASIADGTEGWTRTP